MLAGGGGGVARAVEVATLLQDPVPVARLAAIKSTRALDKQPQNLFKYLPVPRLRSVTLWFCALWPEVGGEP